MPGKHGSSLQLPPSLIGVLAQPIAGSHSLRLQRSATSSGQVTSKPPEHWPLMQMDPWIHASAPQAVPFSAVLQMLFEQVWHVPQGLPHSSRVPHSVVTAPQRPSQVIIEVQPQTPAIPPPPQLCGAVQRPQSWIAPQSSVKVPQLNPAEAHEVVGWQTQALPRQTRPAPQSPS